MTNIQFRYGNDLDLDQVIDLYKESTLGERRPIDDRRIMSDMRVGPLYLKVRVFRVTSWGLLLKLVLLLQAFAGFLPRTDRILTGLC